MRGIMACCAQAAILKQQATEAAAEARMQAASSAALSEGSAVAAVERRAHIERQVAVEAAVSAALQTERSAVAVARERRAIAPSEHELGSIGFDAAAAAGRGAPVAYAGALPTARPGGLTTEQQEAVERALAVARSELTASVLAVARGNNETHEPDAGRDDEVTYDL